MKKTMTSIELIKKIDKISRCPREILASLAFLLPISISEVSAQQVLQENQVWTSQVLREEGQPVIPTYEGWFPNPDETFTLCYGYFNLNTKESLEIPLGQMNRLEGVDDGVVASLPPPTHFD